MKLTTVKQWCLVCAATATIAAALPGCVEEGDPAPPNFGQQGPAEEVVVVDAGGSAGAAGSMGTAGAAGADMGAAGAGTGGAAGSGMGAGADDAGTDAAADAS